MIQFTGSRVGGKNCGIVGGWGKLTFQVLCLLLVTDIALTENRTPARQLAKKTGAAQFEEHFEQPLNRDYNENHHRLRKRSSDEDLDYEVYQGVVGRPGIDFPIFPRIPQTTFSCRTYGNGYFADLETGCQVFHICEEGRKISFLCPNGTIFQQSELTCDWWFKVNCAGSPSYYVESAEILSRARGPRVKPTPAQKSYSVNKKVNAIATGKPYKGSERRIDSSENPSVESLDFEDISDDRSGGRSSERPNSRSNSRNRPTETSNSRSNEKLKIEKEKLLSQSPSDDKLKIEKEKLLSQSPSDDKLKIEKEKLLNQSPSDDKLKIEKEKLLSQSPSDDKLKIEKEKLLSQSPSDDKLKIEKEKLLSQSPSDDNPNHLHNEQELQITAETGSFVNDQRNSYNAAGKTLDKNGNVLSDKPLDKNKDSTSPNIPRGNQKDFNERQKSGKKIDDKKPAGFYITVRPDIGLASTAGKISYQTTAQPDLYTNRNSLDDSAANDKQFVTPETIDRSSKTTNTYGSVKPDFFVNGPILKSSTVSYPGTYSTARRIDTTRTTPFYTPTIPSVARSKTTESKTFFINVVKSDGPTTSHGSTSTDSTPRPLVIGLRHDDSEVHRVPIFTNGELNAPAFPAEPPKVADKAVTSSTSGPTYLPKNIDAGNAIRVTPGSSQDSVSRNIEGIIQTVNVLKETMKKTQDGKNGTRIGLEIPPSSGPGTLVSLTNYFANDDQFTSTVNSDEPTTTTPSVDIGVGLLSNKTSGKYFSLFGLAHNDTDSDSDGILADQVPAGTTASPKIINTPTVIGDFTRTTIRDLVKNPETRKIAQVFSNAITKYIENPDTFRQDLIDARPTQPTIRVDGATDEPSTTPSSSAESKGNAASINTINTSQAYIPATQKDDTTTSAPAEANDIAKEINSQFDVSTPAYDLGLTESSETTTYRGSSFATSKPELSLSSELLPPNHDEETEHESLQKVQSQSFVKSFNDLNKSPKAISFDKAINSFGSSDGKPATPANPWLYNKSTVGYNFDVTTYKGLTTTQRATERPETNAPSQANIGTSTGTATTTAKPTTSPWSYSTITISTVVHHDVDSKSTTPSNTWLQNKGTEPKSTENPWSQITNSIHLDPLTINDGLMQESKTTTNAPFAFVSADRSRFEDTSDADDSIDDILNSPELSSENLPKNTGLQRIANKIFGGLNETEAVHLKNVMKKAEHNQNVLKLLLLLIQTCDDQNGKALEKSRKLLLNALISMDVNVSSRKNDQTTLTTTNKIPVTTYRRNFSDSTTTIKSPTTTGPSSSSDETTKFEIRVPDPEEEEENTVSTTPPKPVSSSEEKSDENPNRTSDARALELLKSLYSLASKFSRR